MGATEHTFLHEIREILEYIFTGQGFPTTNKEDLEQRAEGFATLVRMKALQGTLTSFIEGLSEITSTHWAIAAFAPTAAGALVCLLGCAYFPQLERLADAQSRSRLGARA
jgi:hypothetical protein